MGKLSGGAVIPVGDYYICIKQISLSRFEC